MDVRTLNIKGKKFGRWKVLDYAYTKNTSAHWLCQCSCGSKRVVKGGRLRDGKSKSCGCLARELSSKWFKKYTKSERHKGRGNPMYTHGDSKAPLYLVFQGMIQRCNNPKAGNYSRYGAVGIRCEWKNYEEFKRDMGDSFYEHVEKFGRQQTSLDRINGKGNYSKNNCRWVTLKEQQRNTSYNRWITYDGKTMILEDWSRLLGMSRGMINHRIKIGWPMEKIVSTPSRKKK